VNRLSGQGKSEEKKAREQVKRGRRGWGRKEGERGGERGSAAPSSSPVYTRLSPLATIITL